MTDAVTLVKDLVALVKEHEIETAARKATAALRQMSRESYGSRGRAINTINIELQRLAMQRNRLRAAILDLPESERVFAQVQVEAVVDKIYEPAITAMKKEKRALARPEKS